MMAPRDPLRAAEKLRQRIVAASKCGPQAVFVSRRGGVECCPVKSARYQALAGRPEFMRRMAGVFDASVSTAQLAAELRAVAI